MAVAPTSTRRRLGELIDAPDHALSFRRLEPVPASPRRLLLLLHGWGGDERQLRALCSRADASTLVVGARGPRSAGEAGFGWYRVSFDEGRPEAVAEEVEDSLDRVSAFIGQLQARHDVARAATIVAGFSQGGALAAAAALARPGCMAGFAMFAGRLLPRIAAQAPGRLPPMEAFIAHGRDDATLHVDWARRADRWLRDHGVGCELKLHAGGHALSAPMRRDFGAWLAAAQRAWNA